MQRKSGLFVVALTAGFLGGLLGDLSPRALAPAQAQEAAPAPGRYRISAIRGAVYLVDSATGDTWMREYQTGNWSSAGNPAKKAE